MWDLVREAGQRLRHWLFGHRRRRVESSESIVDAQCESRLAIQDRPFDLHRGDYIVPFEYALDVTGTDPDHRVVRDPSGDDCFEIHTRNQLLAPETHEIWTADGYRLLLSACRRRWSRDWAVYRPNGSLLCRIVPSLRAYRVVMADGETLSIQTQCRYCASGTCLTVHRSETHHAGRVIAAATRRRTPCGTTTQIRIAPFVDRLVMIVLVVCVTR